VGTAFATGIPGLAFDAKKVSEGDDRISRIMRLTLDSLMCLGTAMSATGFFTGFPPLFLTGIAILGVSGLTRLILACIYQGE
ncbi:MAG: hypothetical protein AAGG81_08960, partial [Chlamydiota bacterium]